MNNSFYSALGINAQDINNNEIIIDEPQIYSNTGYITNWLTDSKNEWSKWDLISKMKLEGKRVICKINILISLLIYIP